LAEVEKLARKIHFILPSRNPDATRFWKRRVGGMCLCILWQGAGQGRERQSPDWLGLYARKGIVIVDEEIPDISDALALSDLVGVVVHRHELLQSSPNGGKPDAP
jgi:hypothetical protein